MTGSDAPDNSQGGHGPRGADRADSANGLDDWQAQVAEIWSRAHDLAPDDLVSEIDRLAADRAAGGDAAALFEQASARDTAGVEGEAVPLYRTSLATGELDDYRRRRAVIQLASSLRLLGQFDESEDLLRTELALAEAGSSTGADPEPHALHDELRAVLALTLIEAGRPVEAAALALETLAPHLSRYNRSVAGNAAEVLARARREHT